MSGTANARDPAWFANEIRTAWAAAWQNTVEGIFKTGAMLETAKAELSKADFVKMYRDDLKWSQPMVSQLLAVAGDDKLQNDYHANQLPPSWATLYALTRLSADEFQAGIDSGAIHSAMERKDVAKLRPPKPKKERPPPAIDPQSACLATVRRLIFETVEQLPPDEVKDLFAEIKADIDELEQQTLEGIGNG